MPAKVTAPRECLVCDGFLSIGGPIWNQKLHNVDFLKRISKVVRDQEEVKLGTAKRIQGIITGIIDESPVQDNPLAYDITFITSSLKHGNLSKKEFLYGLSQHGYKASQTYYSSKLWKTDAPPDIIYDLFKVHKH